MLHVASELVLPLDSLANKEQAKETEQAHKNQPTILVQIRVEPHTTTADNKKWNESSTK